MPSKSHFVMLLISLMSLTALGAETSPQTSPHCNQFTPENVDAVAHDAVSTLTDAEIWCYQRVETPQPGLLIYNVDQGEPKPELTQSKAYKA